MERPLVFVPMAADIIHHGHINILKKSSQYGSVIVGLITDKGLETYKGKPIIKFTNRKKIIIAIKYVDYIIPLDGLTFAEIADKLKINFFVHGYDWKKGPQKKSRENLIKVMKKWGGKVIEIPYSKNISSTKIKKIYDNKNKG